MLKFLKAAFGKLGDPDAPEQRGVIATCECGDKRFLVFQLDGQDHFHLECFTCSTSYCPQGSSCNAMESNS